jgi:hypothetical protein
MGNVCDLCQGWFFRKDNGKDRGPVYLKGLHCQAQC